MKDSLKLFPLFAVLILLVFAPFILQARGKPVLYGKISLKVSRGSIPLGRATVELRKAAPGSPGKGLFKTYTDSRGNFAFYSIPRGRYFLIVLRGRNAFYQLDGNKKDNKRMVTITNPASSQRLPDITVVK